MSAILDIGLTPEQRASCAIWDALDKALDAQIAVQRATVYRPRCGRRPALATAELAAAYERGFEKFHWGQEPTDDGERSGWIDADREYADLREAADDRRREARGED